MLRVLAYHRVAVPQDTPELDPGIVSATPEVFRKQMLHLRKWYRPVSLPEVAKAFLEGGPLPRRAVLVTVDDAYRDFGEVSWPILRELGIPVTLFVPTAYPGDSSRQFWWDRLQGARARTPTEGWRQAVDAAMNTLPSPFRGNGHGKGEGDLRSLLRWIPHDEAEGLVDLVCEKAESWTDARAPTDARTPAGPVSSAGTASAAAATSAAAVAAAASKPSRVLDWDELRALREEGVSVGAHTRHHVALAQVDEDRARAEIRQSLDDLGRELGEKPFALAYPYGIHDSAVLRIAKEEGCLLAFTTEDGLSRPGRTDPLRLPRTNITPRTSAAVFRLRMMPWFSRVDEWRHRPRGPRQGA